MIKSGIFISSTLFSLLGLANSFYIPESGEDWTQLKPETEPVAGSLDSLPFDFGIVVNPYSLDTDGDYVEPTPTSYIRSITTTFTTSVVTEAPKATKSGVIVQINDGQVQRQVSATEFSSEITGEASDESWKKREDDQEEASGASGEDLDDDEYEVSSPVYAVSCRTNSALTMTLEDSVLRDSSGRIGSVVGNRQFQFDGPVPQYGTIYASGWYISPQGRLELGNTTKFYQCASGEFYNLYDSPIDTQCSPVSLDVVELIDC